MSETAAPEQAPAQAPAAEPGPAPAADPRLRLPAAVLAVVATVVVALLLVALVVRLDADRLPSGPPRDPPAPDAVASRLTVDGRKVSFQELSVTLPGEPYACNDGSEKPPANLVQVVTCFTVVHEDYDAAGSDWGALMGVALVDPVLSDGSMADVTETVFNAVAYAAYRSDQRPRFSKRSSAAAQLAAPAGAAWTQQADVRVTVKDLPTPYDRLVVIAVRLESGKVVAFFSDFPHDGSKQALQALVDSLGTLEAVR